MGRRVVLLITAIVVAAIGTTLVFLYASSANDRALANQNPVEVLVAKSDISANMSAREAEQNGLFLKKTVARDAAAPTALPAGDLSRITGKVALSKIYAGEQILPEMFGAQGQVSGLAIPNGMSAVSVQLGDSARVAGFVTPGSKVAVIATMSATGGGSGATGLLTTRVLLPSALVIAVGPSTTLPAPATSQQRSGQNTNPEQLSRAIVTLALGPQDALKLIYAAQNGQLSFALLTNKSGISKESAGVNSNNLFN